LHHNKALTKKNHNQQINMMKQLAILIAFFSLLYQTEAQQKSAIVNGPSNWKTFSQASQQPAKKLAQNKAALLLSSNDALHLIATTEDELGFKHYRYQQHYKGIPVEGAIYLMHEKEGKVTLSNGQLVQDLEISVKPTFTKSEALQLAIQHVPAKLYAWQSIAKETQLKRSKNNPSATYFPKGILTIIDSQFSPKADNYRLAYKFNVYALEPFVQKEVYVDAHNGEILLELNNIHSCTETIVNANTNYSNNVNVSVCTENGEATQLKSSLYGGLEIRYYKSDDLVSIEDSVATEILWATQKTFDYFNIRHNKNFADTITISEIDYSGVLAFYDSGNGVVVYGGGNGTTHNAYTTPDIVGHELTHGVNKFSANLYNSYESGALNESFADIFGELIEHHCLGTADWILGAQVSPGNQGLRNLANPKDETMKTPQPNTYMGENWILRSSVCIRNGDYCGVHRNSGVQNYWFYLLANGGSGTNDNGLNYNIEAIGVEKAAQITYRNLITYLTSRATYRDARQGAIQSAIDLFGENSFEVKQTRKAWRAVGVMHNPIKLTTTNEIVLADGSIQFDLLLDSLSQNISANDLIIHLDVQNNYDISSIELLHPQLLMEESNLNFNTISINRVNAQFINTNEPVYRIFATLKPNAAKTTFEINGGTNVSNNEFIPFEHVLFNLPIESCSDEKNTYSQNYTQNTFTPNLKKDTQFTPNTTQFTSNTHTLGTQTMLTDISKNPQSLQNTQFTPNCTQFTLNTQTPSTQTILKGITKNPHSPKTKATQKLSNGLPLIISIIYESCPEYGSAIVKIIDTKSAPYTHIWRDAEETIVYEYTGYEQEVEVPNLEAGLYQVTVSDTDGNCAAFEAKILLLADRYGNNLCSNRCRDCSNQCPDYLVTPNENLQGTYNAKFELEVKGYVSSSKNASFNICN